MHSYRGWLLLYKLNIYFHSADVTGFMISAHLARISVISRPLSVLLLHISAVFYDISAHPIHLSAKHDLPPTKNDFAHQITGVQSHFFKLTLISQVPLV